MNQLIKNLKNCNLEDTKKEKRILYEISEEISYYPETIKPEIDLS